MYCPRTQDLSLKRDQKWDTKAGMVALVFQDYGFGVVICPFRPDFQSRLKHSRESGVWLCIEVREDSAKLRRPLTVLVPLGFSPEGYSSRSYDSSLKRD